MLKAYSDIRKGKEGENIVKDTIRLRVVDMDIKMDNKEVDMLDLQSSNILPKGRIL